MLTILLYTFLAGISQKLGPGVLLNWALGRYHEPKEVARIFMFLDIRDSTGLAEQLGPLKFSGLIRDFFSDITTPLLDHNAEVSHFIGDEVVLCWPVAKGIANANCVRCFFAIEEEICRRAPVYRQRYGVVPTFKAGAHIGTVIATDVGQIKSEIVYHGDVLNVASRLQSLCKEEGADLLVSSEVASLMPTADLTFDNLGPRSLKGREQQIEIVRCRQS